MPERIAIRSQRVLTPNGIGPAAVLVEGERIAAILAFDAVPPDVPCEDHGARVLMPGLVDVHVHLNDPGRADWEGFESGSRAAAAGGFTTLVDMPLNSEPVTTTADGLARKRAAAAHRIWVDCGLWGGLVPGNADQLPALLAGGVLGVKAFLAPSGLGAFPPITDVELRAAMPLLREARVPLLAHAELVSACAAPAEGDPRSYRRYLASRPAAWEEDAVALLIRLAREIGCAVHVVHLSAASALPALHAARGEGLPITVETCPHYLSFCADDIPDGDARFKCAPPIREAANRTALWRGLGAGDIDLVASDHSPCPPELKQIESGDLDTAWGGVASLQLTLPATWTQARRRGHGLADLVRWLAQEPARVAGLRARKGALAPGFDADLLAFDPDARQRVTRESLHTRHSLSPWLSLELDGVVEATWLRGQPVYRRGSGFSGTPRGRILAGRDSAA